MAQSVKNPSAMQETQVQSLAQEDPLEWGMATHTSTLVWRMPRTEEPGGLTVSSWGCKESDTTEVTEHACMHACRDIISDPRDSFR